SAWDWGETTLTSSDGHTYTFTLSAVTGSGKPYDHSGLLTSMQKPEFIFVLKDKEYKDASGNALMTGGTAQVKVSGGSFAATTVKVYDKAGGGNGNTYIQAP